MTPCEQKAFDLQALVGGRLADEHVYFAVFANPSRPASIAILEEEAISNAVTKRAGLAYHFHHTGFSMHGNFEDGRVLGLFELPSTKLKHTRYKSTLPSICLFYSLIRY